MKQMFGMKVLAAGSALALLGVPVQAEKGLLKGWSGSVERAIAQPQPVTVERPDVSPFMRTYGEVVTAPYGAVEFCKTSEGEEACKASAMRERVGLDAHDMGALETVNELVNKGFKGMSDLEARGVTEDWRIPTDVADCEDYALLKRKMLMERGWPASALLMTVVRDEKGEGHAVLTARTAQGDFVLDNKHEGVKIWHKTPYQFVMRQSYLNPKVWVALAPEYAKDGRVAGR